MARNIYFAIALFSIILIPNIVSAACASTFAVCYSGFQDWLPVILGGAALVISITVLHYFGGVILNNARMKGTAISEIEQALGTILLVVAILGIMFMMGSGTGLAYNALLSGGPTPITGTISSICQNILIHSQVGFLNPLATSSGFSSNPPLFPQPYGTGVILPQPTNAVCGLVKGNNGLDPVTTNLDYGLAATYVITANLTNQSIVELNALYNYDSFTFFLRGIQSYASICEPFWCALPISPRTQETTLWYKLYNGYVLHRTVMPTVITQANLSIYLFMSELVVIIVLLVSWPYLLAAGILLRVFTVTRRAGGLLIAGVLTGVILYPTLFLFQYAGLSHLAPLGTPLSTTTTQTQALGAGEFPAVSLCGVNINTPVDSHYVEAPPPASSFPPFVTQYQLFCYTSSNALPISQIYLGTQPQCNTSTTNGCATLSANLICGLDLDPVSAGTTNILCACPAGNSGFTFIQPVGSSPTVPNCYTKKNISFYAFPSEASVLRLYTCYPPDFASADWYSKQGTGPSGLLALEVNIINNIDSQSPLKVLLTLSNIFSQLAGQSTPSGLSPLTPLGNMCDSFAPQNLIAGLAATINLYGVISVTGFILPVINILMLISAMFGLSQLLGGETNIIGLSRFI